MTAKLKQDKILKLLTAFILEKKLDLEELQDLIARFNPFHVLKVDRHEIRHSNFLAWLFNPAANHGAGSFFLDSLVSLLKLDEELKIRILLSDHTATKVFRERNNRDIEITNLEEQWSIIIENKFLSGLSGKNQLQNFYNSAIDEFDFEPIFVFLEPGSTILSWAEGGENYQSILYQDISNFIVNALKTLDIEEEIKVFLKYYLENLMERNMTSEKSKAQKIAKEIYYRHAEAIEYIIKNKPRVNGGANPDIIDAFILRNESYLSITPGNTKMIRFLPKELLDYFKGYKCWGNQYLFAIELMPDESSLWAKFCFANVPNDSQKSSNQHLKDELFNEMSKFKSIAAYKTKSRSSSKYPAAAWVPIMKVDEGFIQNDFEDYLQARFTEFEQRVLKPWIDEVKTNKVFQRRLNNE
jgi:hypothetical protein